MNSSEFYFYFTIIMQLVMISTTVYLFIISALGWNQRSKTAEKAYPPTKRFAIVIAAHNENRVIASSLESFNKLKYPKELYDIFVIADNCTDNTAELARNAGAIVYERNNKVQVGKGYALQWMFEKIFAMEKKYDAIGVFDADNLVSSNFLARMNDMFCNGHKVIQGYLDIKNPYDSWVTLTYSIMYWITNRLFNQSRSNLDMWCTIGGTGFCIDTQVLKDMPWDSTCLTEDLEYTVKLVLNGIKISWCSDAFIYDEKPLTFMQSWNQRKRWMQGHVDVFSRFFLKLLKKGIKDRSITALDLAIYNFQPINIVLTFFISILISIFALGMKTYSVTQAIQSGLLPQWAMYLLLGFINIFPIVSLYILPIIVLIAEKRFNFKVFLGLFIFPIFGLTWIPIIILGMINRNKKEWNHTLHTREITINELEQA